MHWLQIQYVNVFREKQQLKLRRWNFITLIKGKLTKFLKISPPKYTLPTSYGSF